MKQLLLFLTWCIASTAFAQKGVYNAIVAADGSGDYTTVQAAIDAVPDDNLSQYLIYIKAGTYNEHVYIPLNKSRLSIIGEGADKVFISDNKKSGGPGAIPVDKAATVVVHANDITFQGISFVNSHGVEAQAGPQALALYAKGDRIAFDHCAMLSYQDTYRTSEADNGRNYVSNSLIMGGVDFIYGSGNAWFAGNTGKEAVTRVIPLGYGKHNKTDYTLAKFCIETGRTHQIRSQSALHGYPLLGDTAYGGTKIELIEYFLHAYELYFPKNNPLALPEKIKAEVPKVFANFLKTTMQDYEKCVIT